VKKACVIGWPVSHSRSPLIHNYWLDRLGIAGRYERIAVEPAQLRSFLGGLGDDGYVGCNVTLPHKEAAFGLVTVIDEATRRIEAVNTIHRRDGRLLGLSTDGEGFVSNLKANAPGVSLKNERAVVLGAGGAARAIVAALVDAGIAEIAVTNRTKERGLALRSRFGSVVAVRDWERRHAEIGECALLVNTTSLGMTGQPRLDLDLTGLQEGAVVADIVYTPLLTPLLTGAMGRGHAAVGGLGMLLHQAVGGFELWFGRRPEVTRDLFDMVARDIDPGYRG
jgi:shikimate dehydrogenase